MMTNVKTEPSSSSSSTTLSISSSNQDNSTATTTAGSVTDKNPGASTTTNDLQNNLQPTPGSLKNVSDRVLIAKAKLVESPYDLDAWNILIKDVQVISNSISKLLNLILIYKFQNKTPEISRELYEQLVSQFPTSGRFWRLSIEQEIKCKNYERVEKVCFIFTLNSKMIYENNQIVAISTLSGQSTQH